jgi:hypothetical protein
MVLVGRHKLDLSLCILSVGIMEMHASRMFLCMR